MAVHLCRLRSFGVPVLVGAAVMTAAAFFETHMALLTWVGLAIMLISVAVFLVWCRRNMR